MRAAVFILHAHKKIKLIPALIQHIWCPVTRLGYIHRIAERFREKLICVQHMGDSQCTGADISAIITCIVPSTGQVHRFASPQRDRIPSMACIPCKSSCVLFFQSHTASLEIQKFKKRVLQGLVYTRLNLKRDRALSLLRFDVVYPGFLKTREVQKICPVACCIVSSPVCDSDLGVTSSALVIVHDIILPRVVTYCTFICIRQETHLVDCYHYILPVSLSARMAPTTFHPTSIN